MKTYASCGEILTNEKSILEEENEIVKQIYVKIFTQNHSYHKMAFQFQGICWYKTTIELALIA